MTKTEIYTLLTSILGGLGIDTDLFNTLLQMSKNARESERDWMILRDVDMSITFSSSDDYQSTKTLPTRFIKPYQNPKLITSNGGEMELFPIGKADAYAKRNLEGYYYIDYKNGTIGRTGTTAGTLHLPYTAYTADISDSLAWVFPSYAHPLLAFDIAIMQKGGIDWDVVSSYGVPYNEKTIKSLESKLNAWDADLQTTELGV